MANPVPVETPLGSFFGRDCIYLDSVDFDIGSRTLVLEGAINGNLCTNRRPGHLVPYSLRFVAVLALKMVELDSDDATFASCFDEVRDSDWVRSLGGKVTPEFRHFYLQTYDEVFEIVCQAYEFVAHETGS